jgi:acetoin utilization deacetylase AcuC-like enzyme
MASVILAPAADNMTIITDPRCVDYVSPGHPEAPQRVSGCVEKLRSQQSLPLHWGMPVVPSRRQLLRGHSAAHMQRLEAGEDLDEDTPALPGIAAHARRSVGGTLAALQSVLQGETAFSLMRPPGHHATSDQSMGFCYLSNVALGVLEAARDKTRRIAVLDFDVHHGNGTEAILHQHPRCCFFSVHQYPAYPGTGLHHRDNCRNYSMRPGTPREVYREALAGVVEEIRGLKPDLLAVSAGFDAYRGDPLAEQCLELEDYYWLGSLIFKLRVPAFSALEGGYSADLPELLLAYLTGLAGR